VSSDHQQSNWQSSSLEQYQITPTATMSSPTAATMAFSTPIDGAQGLPASIGLGLSGLLNPLEPGERDEVSRATLPH
jgi:hypothetical protein